MNDDRPKELRIRPLDEAPSADRPERSPHHRPSEVPRSRSGSGEGSAEGRSAARRALLVAAGLAGGAVAGLAVARRLGRDVPPIYRTLRAAPREFPFRGYRVVRYADGPEPAPPVVLVHGIHAAASAWEMRALFERLAEDHRVHACDLLGFGASERPEIDYDAELYVDLLRELLRREVRGPAHVVASSLSAAYALELAADEPGAFASLAVLNPTGLLAQAEGQRTAGRLVEGVLRAPWIGEALYNLLVSGPSLRHFLGRVYAQEGRGGQRRRELLEEGEAQRYATAHQPGARFAPAAFLGDALACNTYLALRNLEVPLLAVWSEDGGLLDTRDEQAAFAGIAPDSEHRWIESGGAPHEEAPEEVTGILREWIGRHAQR